MSSSGKDNPWKTLSTHLAFENPWFAVTVHDTIAPDGSRPVYGKISFRNLAVAVIPVDEEDHTWLVGQWRFPLGQYSWELPMGGSPLDTDPLESARRELKEETGLSATHWGRSCGTEPTRGGMLSVLTHAAGLRRNRKLERAPAGRRGLAMALDGASPT